MPATYNNYANLITFSRASNATLTDVTGRITYAPNNLILQSQTFDNASWTKNNTTISADSTVAPDGTTTADALIENTATSTHQVYQLPGLAVSTYTVSVYAKANGRTQFRIQQESGGDSQFTLTGSGTATALGANSASITALANGWYRCSTTFTVTGAFGVYITLYNGTSTSYTGDGVSGIYLWGAQTERVTYQTVPSTYTATTAAAYYGPRLDYNPTTLAVRGLLVEEARTNVILNSATPTTSTGISVTTVAGAAPDGLSAARITKTDATTPRYAQYLSSFTSQSTTNYAVSAYFKYDGYNTTVSLEFNTTANWGVDWVALFNVSSSGVTAGSATNCTSSVQSVGNGWYRAIATFTTTTVTSGTNPRFLIRITGGSDVSVLCWGAQLEAGTFATSYIPTVASSVVRQADLITMTGTQFSPWYNQNDGTFVMSLETQYTATSGLGITPTFINLANLTGANGYVAYYNNLALSSYDGTSIANADVSNWSNVRKFASSYGSANKSLVYNGGTVVSTAYNGGWSAGNQLSTTPRGWIQSITYYPRRLSDTQIQALTT